MRHDDGIAQWVEFASARELLNRCLELHERFRRTVVEPHHCDFAVDLLRHFAGEDCVRAADKRVLLRAVDFREFENRPFEHCETEHRTILYGRELINIADEIDSAIVCAGVHELIP